MRPGPAVALIAALLATAACGGPADVAQHVSTYDLPRAAQVEGLGGLSGLELSDDGTRVTALSDRGMIFHGTITRAEGQITAIGFEPGIRLRGAGGATLGEMWNDSEGLATAPDGSTYISFENKHRLTKLAPDGRTLPLPTFRAFKTLQLNSGIEALAVDDQGRLYAMPERSGHVRRPFPVWRLEDGTWREVFSIPRHVPFLPVGADFGPDGRLYVLERNFTGLGFASRIRAFSLEGNRIAGETTLLETGTGQYGNLEGLSVWRDTSGAIRLTMVADDNFLGFLPSQIVEYALPLAPATHTN